MALYSYGPMCLWPYDAALRFDPAPRRSPKSYGLYSHGLYSCGLYSYDAALRFDPATRRSPSAFAEKLPRIDLRSGRGSTARRHARRRPLRPASSMKRGSVRANFETAITMLARKHMGHNCIGHNYTGTSKLETELATLHEELEAAKTALARARVYFGQYFSGHADGERRGLDQIGG